MWRDHHNQKTNVSAAAQQASVRVGGVHVFDEITRDRCGAVIVCVY
jgi:hypothetical protein